MSVLDSLTQEAKSEKQEAEVIAAPAKTKSKAATNVKDDEQIAVAIAQKRT